MTLTNRMLSSGQSIRSSLGLCCQGYCCGNAERGPFFPPLSFLVCVFVVSGIDISLNSSQAIEMKSLNTGRSLLQNYPGKNTKCGNWMHACNARFKHCRSKDVYVPFKMESLRSEKPMCAPPNLSKSPCVAYESSCMCTNRTHTQAH